MSYKGSEIHDMAIALIDEISDNGSIDVDDTSEYRNRAPYLLELGCKELGDSLYFISEYENTDETNVYKWSKYTLPTDFRKIREIIFEDSDMQMPSIPFKQFGKSEVYFWFEQTGKARMLYIPILPKITEIDEDLSIDETLATALAYHLAQHYAIADQNDDLAKICRDKFKELKDELAVKPPLSPQDIHDSYGISNIR